MKEMFFTLAVKLTLIFIWIFTGICVLFLSRDTCYTLLANANVEGFVAVLFVWMGGLLNMTLGLWLLTHVRIKWCLWTQAITIVVLTILASFLAPSFWIHPFAPLSKNFALLLLIIYLYNHLEKQA